MSDRKVRKEEFKEGLFFSFFQEAELSDHQEEY